MSRPPRKRIRTADDLALFTASDTYKVRFVVLGLPFPT